MAADDGSLDILFRYLMLYYSSPQGLRVLVPSAVDHRAVLRDKTSGVAIPLHQAAITLETDGQPVTGGRTRIHADDRTVVFENVVKVSEPQAPADRFLETPVDPALNALVSMPDGVLRAFPPEAFPEKDERVTIKFGPSHVIDQRITDTTLFQRELAKGRRHELVVRSPRTTVRIDISGGARFELRNEDDLGGPIPDRITYHTREFEAMLALFGQTANVECDYFTCGFMITGEGPIAR